MLFFLYYDILNNQGETLSKKMPRRPYESWDLNIYLKGGMEDNIITFKSIGFMKKNISKNNQLLQKF
jgi:hypothetical protein